MADYKSEIVVGSSRETLFEFFLHPENVREVTLPDLELTFVEAPDKVEVGSTIEFEVTKFGQKIAAKHEITRADDFCIQETQVSGAMTSWCHTRRFEAVADDRCRIENEISFEGPGGLVGVIMNEGRIRAGLDEGFEYQYEQLKERFGE